MLRILELKLNYDFVIHILYHILDNEYNQLTMEISISK